jgi:CheY-like chemotaxis protein
MILEDETNAEYREVKRRQEVCGKILDILVREAAAHGAHSVEVVTSDGKTRYQFCTSHGRVAAGTIHPEVIQDLLKYLCSLEGSVIKTESKGDVCLRSMGSSSNFRLSWGGVAALPATIVESAAREKPAPIRMPPPQPPVSPVEVERSRGGEPLDLHPILVVDDNPMFCRVLERLLKKENVAPCFADNGIIALERLANAKEVLPKIIICDLHMPVMNGRELLAAVKGDPRLRDIPVIMLTSDDDVDAELQLLSGGADAFISKAKDPRVLTAQVQRLLRRGVLREAA